MRKILFWLHLAAGCLAGIVILIMSVTGTLLTYERHIVAWADGNLHSTAGTRLPMETLLERSSPDRVPGTIAVHSDPAAPVELGYGRDRTVFVDSSTGAILGEGSQRARNFFRLVEDWHRWLAVSGDGRSTGRAITGASNFIFLFIVISGPFLWLPRKWSAKNVKSIALFRGGLSDKARDFNWHNVIGIWCAIPLFAIVLSAVVMSYPWANNLLYRLTGTQPPAQAGGGGPRGNAVPGQPNWKNLDAAWTRAEQQTPGWKTITLRLPQSEKAPLAFTVDQGQGGRPDQRAQLTLDRRTADVIRWEPFSTYNRGRQLRTWFRFIHTGEAGGLAGQTIAGIATTGAAVLVWTGLALALRRLRRYLSRRETAKIEVCSSPPSSASTTSAALPIPNSSAPTLSNSDSDSAPISSAKAAPGSM